MEIGQLFTLRFAAGPGCLAMAEFEGLSFNAGSRALQTKRQPPLFDSAFKSYQQQNGA